MEQLAQLGLDIPVCGLAKSDEEVFVPWDETPVVLPSGSPSLYLIKQVRDESHRFAITYHRTLRSKRVKGSQLDEIPGIGEKRRLALLKRFGSLTAIREASVEQLSTLLPAPTAKAVYDHFHPQE